MDDQNHRAPEDQYLRRALADQLRQLASGGIPQQVDHGVQPHQPTISSFSGYAPTQTSQAQLPSSAPTPYNSAAGIYQPSYAQQGQVYQPSPLRSTRGASGDQIVSASTHIAYGTFSGSASSKPVPHGIHAPPGTAQLPPSATNYHSPYQHQTSIPQGRAVSGSRAHSQLAPRSTFARNNQPHTTYPPNAVPLGGPVASPAGVPPQTGVSSSLNNLLQILPTPNIQRPQFTSPRCAPVPAGYPAPVIQPAPVPVHPTMVRIKYLTDTFNAAATNDPVFYLIYCSMRGAEPQNVPYPGLVFFLRLQFQIGWIDLLERHHRRNEIEGETQQLLQERKELIEWLVQQDRTAKPRAGHYITGQLAKFAPLSFDPKQVTPLSGLIDHLYVLETEFFYKPVKPAAPTKHQYRIQVATYLDYEGGEPRIIQDVNIQKSSTWTEMQRILSALTQNIQSAQLGYNYGWIDGGYHGHWLFWAGEIEEPLGWNRLLMTEANFLEMKSLLALGQKVYIEHSQQVEVRENLELADALGLGLDRPYQACKRLPPGYRSSIMGAYPNPMEASLLSRDNGIGGSGTQNRPRRGKPSVLAHQHQLWLRKQRQRIKKARVFELRGKK